MTRKAPFAAALPVLLLAAPLCHADQEWFMGIGTGTSNFQDYVAKTCLHNMAKAGLTGDCSASTGAPPIHLYGGYNLSELWGIEGGFTRLGNSNYNATVTTPNTVYLNGSEKAYAVDGDLFIKFYPAARFVIQAKLGGYYAMPNLSGSTSSGDTIVSHSNSIAGVMLGLSGLYEINPHYAVSLGITQYKGVGEAATPDQSNVNMYLLGLTYTFR